MKFILNYIRKETWSPYVAGVLLGLVGIATVWISNSLLGASGAFENLAGLIGKAVAPKLFDNMYFNFIMPPGITFGVIMFVGTFFGGMLGALTSGTLMWGKKRWVLAFIGAIILEYAAGIAGGCTSGLAISGGMLLAPAAFLFIMGMFASGILTALVIYRKNY